MKQIATDELVSAVPLEAEVKSEVKSMTRREKLLHWASLVRKTITRLMLHSGLEYYSGDALTRPGYWVDGYTAFGLAMMDPAFQALGLRGQDYGDGSGRETGTIAQIMGFFELTQAQLHEFSCDCGGSISNTQMADRIERLAG